MNTSHLTISQEVTPARFCVSALQQGKSQLLLERPANPSSKMSDYFPSPTELLLKAQNSA